MSLQFIPRRQVAVPEIPTEDHVRLPAQKTALIVVDMQNDFVKPDGALVVEAAAETVPRIQRLLETARAHDVPIAYTQDTHLEEDVEWENWPEHVQLGSWGWEIVDELKPRPGDLICQKNRYDGFYGTWLDHFVSYVWRIEHLILVGTVANICVLHTAASAGLRYLHLVVPAQAISALNDFDQALTLRQISWLYTGTVVRSVDDVQFEDVVSVDVPRRQFEWCREQAVEEGAGVQMAPQEQRIAELEAQLCQRDAAITDLKSRLAETVASQEGG